MQPVPTIPAHAVGNLRRSVIMASCLGVASLLVLGFIGHLAMALFLCFGLALGAGNTRLVQLAVVSFTAGESAHRKARFTRSVLIRLAAITLITVICALLVRPDGLGVFVGLALFQLLMLGAASIPVVKSLRQS